ncbi:hypothetical protein [Halostagnicola bangensis]
MSKSDSRSDTPDEDIDWDETDLWEGIQDAKDDNFVRPEYEFEF